MEDDLRWETTFDGRQHLTEDDLHRKDFEIPLCRVPSLRSFFYILQMGKSSDNKVNNKFHNLRERFKKKSVENPLKGGGLHRPIFNY